MQEQKYREASFNKSIFLHLRHPLNTEWKQDLIKTIREFFYWLHCDFFLLFIWGAIFGSSLEKFNDIAIILLQAKVLRSQFAFPQLLCKWQRIRRQLKSQSMDRGKKPWNRTQNISEVHFSLKGNLEVKFATKASIRLLLARDFRQIRLWVDFNSN